MKTKTRLPGQQQPKDTIVGTWKLVSSTRLSVTGEVTYLYGESPMGFLTYDSNGRMSVQIMRPDRPKFGSGDPLRGTPEEIKAAFESFVAYLGTYSVDEAHGTVTHHVQAGSFPNWVGTDLQRFFTLSGRQLTLRTPQRVIGGQTGTATLVWERLD